ncbi:TPA: transcriptional regulator [Klebsiella oxytoca]|uniref:Transcriptional regulator n=1 Tax=Klebsiella oxytoca TaxID=571 RepID=A0AAN5LEP2_KLEOX|nr:transcriptional regulator [Klebsiella oxytoca]
MATLKVISAQHNVKCPGQTESPADEMRRDVLLNQLREELNASQSELAAAMGMKSSVRPDTELPDNDPRLSALKRYVNASGGDLRIEVTLPTGRRVVFHI